MCNNTHLDCPQRPLLAGAEETLDEPLDGDAAVRFEKVHLREGERESRVHNMGERVSRRVYLKENTHTLLRRTIMVLMVVIEHAS